MNDSKKAIELLNDLVFKACCVEEFEDVHFNPNVEHLKVLIFFRMVGRLPTHDEKSLMRERPFGKSRRCNTPKRIAQSKRK